MYILAFETSCDDTSIAIFRDDELLTMDTASQVKIHEQNGGVVPEIAAREHANVIFQVLENVLKEVYIKSNKEISKENFLNYIDYIAVTTNPGLVPSLLTGITVANTLANILKKPIIQINHIQAHIFSNFLERKERDISYPLVCLTVSGGHNEIYYMEDKWSFEMIGGTTDDSAGEAFDKVSKMMGLGYPGGPIISNLSSEYEINYLKENTKNNLFPRVWLLKDEFNFSFSGLKTAVKREIDNRIIINENALFENKGDFLDELKRLKEEKQVLLTSYDKKEISFEFEKAIVEVLAYKLVNAGKKKGVSTIMLAGGVSANNRLKNSINKILKGSKINFIYPVKNIYSMDNAAMVAINAYYKIIEIYQKLQISLSEKFITQSLTGK